MANTEYSFDIVGQEIKINDFVVYMSQIYQIEAIDNHYLTLLPINSRNKARAILVAADLVVLVPAGNVIVKVLRRG